jgi:hypothetical protein
MASNYTEHYELPIWEKDDAFLRTEFNECNEKIDAALGELSGQIGAVKSSAPKLVMGSYTGTGLYGSGNTVTLTFDTQPLLIFIHSPQGHSVVLRQGISTTYTVCNVYGHSVYATWKENTVTLEFNQYTVSEFNASGMPYQYDALC